jgi:hypothetical protein
MKCKSAECKARHHGLCNGNIKDGFMVLKCECGCHKKAVNKITKESEAGK